MAAGRSPQAGCSTCDNSPHQVLFRFSRSAGARGASRPGRPSAAASSAFVDLLESKGLVQRRPDPTDRRRNVVEVTAGGRRALEQSRRASDEAEQTLLAPLSKADQARLRAALAAVAEVGRAHH